MMPLPDSTRRLSLAVCLAAALVTVSSMAAAQVGALVSPGPLSKAHASLDGIANCQKCHEPGHQVTAARCLACHKPIAARISAKRGVHRDVTTECAGCHAEHAGRDAELRPFDTRAFDHAKTGFTLDGRHGALARDCAKCHKTRSFLTLQPACASCHQDVHKGALGANCQSCHSTSNAFSAARQQFDHSKARFALVGAHRTVDCARCHVNKVMTGLKFATCTDCHKSPHRASFSPDCTSCHSNDSWRTRKVDHAQTGFVLRGAHTTVACERCHTRSAVTVRVKADRCSTCHTDVHRGQFTQDCQACHTEASFKSGSFNHATATRFALTGKHAAIACARCHKNASTTGAMKAAGATSSRTVDFRGQSSACVSCHDDVHHGSTSPTCDSCHGTDAFKTLKPYSHDARLAAFFVGRHRDAGCGSCHGGGGAETTAHVQPIGSWRFRGLGEACVTCHTDPHERELGTACERCHAIDEPHFSASRFSHSATAFPLTGRHQGMACSACHKRKGASGDKNDSVRESAPGRTPGTVPVTLITRVRPIEPQAPPKTDRVLRFKNAQTNCSSCHIDPHLGQVGPRCETCHTTETFAVKTYAHKNPALSTFFARAHATVACQACHKSEQGKFPSGSGRAVRLTGMGSACATCHATKDVHRGALGTACETCHTPERWASASRAFHKDGTFPLDGRHLTVPCASCHTNGVTKGTPTQCETCHWIRRRDDPYETRLGTQCAECHRPTSWTAVMWKHGARTGFPINPAHQVLRCDTCHKDRRFVNASMNCSSCHMDAYQRTTQPKHAAAGFPTTCETCHLASHSSWTQASFNHSTVFPLVGLHATQACATCHKNNTFAGTATTCFGCHAADYQKTSTPNHAAASFPTTCDQCHRATDASWKSGVNFNHSAYFPLVGLHAAQACATCHKNGVYKGTPNTCVGCHLADYQKTTAPNHTAAGFSTTCDSCHKATDASFASGNGFNHASVFPLVGLHATQACATCHKNGVYKGTPNTCVGCHLAAYQKTTAPNHTAAGFSTTCDSCHKATDASFTSGNGFNHASVFPLVGLHATQACTACHKNGVYKGTPNTCVGCHLADYQKTTAPNHTAAGFSTTCDSCHKATDASFASGNGFNHASVFPLVGLHATQACTACHKNGVYKGTPNTCVGCHLADYQKTTAPNHTAAGFSTTCDSCHKATDASFASGNGFNHASVFPLVGLHATQACATCHKNGVYKGTPNTCVGCHLSKYQNTTTPNHTAAGFPTTCDTCHKSVDTTWTLGVFNHNQYWPLLGRHLNRACSDCHKNNVYKGTSTACVSCHQSNYTSTKNPNHSAAGFPTTCESCHKVSDTSWSQGTFTHTWFPITSGRHAGIACATCHTTANAFAAFSCVAACHSRTQTDSNHRGVNGYRYDSAACYACHPTGRAG